jgi:hypothetical protein
MDFLAQGAGMSVRRVGGWGPFSGGQLTIIIVTFAILLLFPVGAWALSFSNVAITDPGGTNQAKVTNAGRLKVDTGYAPFGIARSYSEGGAVARATPANLYRLQGAAVTSSYTAYATPPAGKQLVLLSAQISW